MISTLFFLIIILCFSDSANRTRRQSKNLCINTCQRSFYYGSCKFVAFGNSYTDNGIELGESHGIKRFSNGPTWPSYLVKLMGCDPGSVDNYAYSGGLSGRGNYYFKDWSGNLWQIDTYLSSNTRIPSYTMILFEAGGLNDLFLAVGANNSVRAKTEYDVVENNVLGLQKLLSVGASKIIILDVFEGEWKCPASEQDWFKPYAGDFLLSTIAINNRLGDRIARLKLQYPNAKVVFVRTAGIWQDIEQLFTETKKAYDHHKNDSKYGEWHQYVWYDEYHPMTRVHELLAQKAYRTWMLCTK